MISLLFIFFAAFVNGMLDTMCFNEDNSLFTKWGDWWLPRRAFGKYPKILGTTIDGYHLVKYFMIFFIAISPQFYVNILPKIFIFGKPINIDFIVMMLVWGIGFELSRKIFKK